MSIRRMFPILMNGFRRNLVPASLLDNVPKEYNFYSEMPNIIKLISLVVDGLLASQEGLCSMELA
jgi:hypothetical protein